MSPRSLITDDQIVDQDFVTESEFNEFFGTVVITGTETSTAVVQVFSEFFVQSGILVPASGVTLVTGTNTITVGATGGTAPENFSYEVIPSGVTVEVPLYQQMIVHDQFEVQNTGVLILEGTLVLEL